jgi:hypothetical protein
MILTHFGGALMETVVIRTKLREGKSLQDVRLWCESLKARLPEVIESMENEGVLVESAILDRRSDGDYVIYYLKAISVRRAYEVFDKSTLAVDSYYKETWRALFQGREELEVLFDADRITIQ